MTQIDQDAIAADHLETAELMGWDIGVENREWLEQYYKETKEKNAIHL